MRRSAGASSSARRRSARCATPIPRRTWRSRTRSRAGTVSTSAIAAASCAREVTRSRRSRASGCWRSCSGVAVRSGWSSNSASRSLSCRKPISSSGLTVRTRSFGGSASSGRRSSPRDRSTSGSAPTTSSTRSRSPSARPSTGSSTCTRTRTTRACPRSSSSVPSRRCGLAPGTRTCRKKRAWRTASSCSRAISAAASCSRTDRSGSTSRRSRTRLAPRTRRSPRRRGAHGALLDRVGHQARDGGLDRARERARAAGLGRRCGTARLRAGAWAGRGADAGRGQRERRLLPASRELYASRADPVRVQPADAQRPDHARDAGDPRPALHACARRLVRRFSGRSAAGVLSLRAPRRPVR